MRHDQDRKRFGTGPGGPVLGLIGFGWLALLLCAGLLVTSCGDDDDNNGGNGPVDPIYTAEELNAMGWTSFDAGDYFDGVSQFQESVDLDGDLHEARLGLGWTLAYTGQPEEAVAAFDALINVDACVMDAHAGRATASLSVDVNAAIESAQSALDLSNDEYSFYKRPTYDFQDLYLIMAEAHFSLQEYAEARSRVLAAGGNDIDPDNPESWEVAGVTYTTYQAALAMEIERLAALVAADLPGFAL